MNTPLHPRIDWVDHAKGICIILVVMMHATLGVEKAAGSVSWLNGFIEWAKPFRMPDFFLISGLFLNHRIDRRWRSYLDGKLIHFAYFYILWMTIQFVLKGNPSPMAEGLHPAFAYLLGFAEPYGTLWFIYMLAVFFVVTKALRHVPPVLVFGVALMLEVAPISTGLLLVDEFAARYVYFFLGYWLADLVFAYARGAGTRTGLTLVAGLFIWGAINTAFVAAGLAHLPVLGFGLGIIGAFGIVTCGVLLSRFPVTRPIAYCGEHSIVIYLAFFLFMAASRSVLLKLAPDMDLGALSLIVTAAGVIGPILLWWAVRHTPLFFLFERPGWARLASRKRGWHSAPHVSLSRPQAR